MKFFVNVTRLEDVDVYKAVLVRAEPETGVAGPLLLETRGYTPEEAIDLMSQFFRSLGIIGQIVANITDTKEFSILAEKKEIVIPSQSGPGYYTVSYDPNTDTYECECPDFEFRRKEDGTHCKHINEAIFAYDFGVEG